MAECPYMPFWFDAYWLDCSHLSDAEHGRYLLVLKALWTAPRQRIPNDDEWLSRHFRRSIEAIRNEIRPILKEFCECDGNFWTQKRLAAEFTKVSAKRQKQADRAKSRWDKEKSECRGNAGAALQQVAPDGLAENTDAANALDLASNCGCRGNANHTNSKNLNLGLTVGASERISELSSISPFDGEQAAPRRKSRKRPATAIPDGWKPDIEVAVRLGLTRSEAEFQAEKLLNWAKAGDKRYVDWDAVWRNWCLSFLERNGRPRKDTAHTNGHGPPHYGMSREQWNRLQPWEHKHIAWLHEHPNLRNTTQAERHMHQAMTENRT
jgi:uncharacterized protein YdaU (DUF1376 family)